MVSCREVLAAAVDRIREEAAAQVENAYTDYLESPCCDFLE